ncbi:MAG: hypothetical protein SFV52_08705 [Saprospiraceae bacterium]|nr:hypothetical protein [Saprospiraceae bacterium]
MNTKVMEPTSQRMAEVFSALLSSGLMQAQDFPLLEQYARERYQPMTPSTILAFLANQKTAYMEVVGFQPLVSRDNGAMADVSSVVGHLRKARLLTGEEEKALLYWITREKDLSEADLLGMASAVALYSEYVTPEKLLIFLDELQHARIADPEQVAHWRNEMMTEAVIDHYLLLQTCRNSVLLSPWPEIMTTDEGLLELHRKTASVLPELAFEEFAWSWVDDGQGHSDAICVQLTIGDGFYRMRSQVARHESDPHQIVSIDEKNYYKIFNKYLIDQHSPYRLHLVRMPPLPFRMASQCRRWGIIALLEKQAAVLRRNDPVFLKPYIDISDEPFHPVHGTEHWRKAIAQFSGAGLFDYLTPQEIFNHGEWAFQGDLTDYVDLLSAFPNMLLFFDGETGLIDAPYAHLLAQLEAISHGKFVPEDISDEYDPELDAPSHLSFTLKGKYYSAMLLQMDTSCDPAFWRLVQRANAEMHPGTGFYNISGSDEVDAIIYLTDRQRDMLRKVPGMKMKPV